MVDRARPFGLDVRMGARVTDLLRDDAGRVVGVPYTQEGERRPAVRRPGRRQRRTQLEGAQPSLAATELNSSIDIAWIAMPAATRIRRCPGWS